MRFFRHQSRDDLDMFMLGSGRLSLVHKMAAVDFRKACRAYLLILLLCCFGFIASQQSGPPAA